MKLEAKARLQSLVGLLAGVINTVDRPPSTYMDEAEMDHSLNDQSATDDESLTMDDASNPGNTGYVPNTENENLIEQTEESIINSDPGPVNMGTGLGAGHRLLSTGPVFATPDLGDYQTL
jgi:hypothetical protein